MNTIILAFLLLIPALSYGQPPLPVNTEPTGAPDIHYYQLYNGIQMVEFDYLSAYHRRVNYLEQAQPRALTWEMVLGPPHPNVYIFRNERGEIVKRFGDPDDTKLLSVSQSLKQAKAHNAWNIKFGAVVGFSRIRTRYFPYYLIGSKSHNTPGGLGLIDSLGNEVLPKKFDVIWQNDNLFITIKGDTNELRDIDLKVKYSSHEFQLQPAQFLRGFTDISKGDKVGLMDSTGKIIVPCEYDMLVGAFNASGLARVQKNGKVGFVNINGIPVIECKYQNAGDLTEGLFNVRLNDKWGYIDTSGRTIIPHQYEIGCSFSEGLARVAKRNESKYYFGFIDLKGNEVIPLSYSNAKDFANGIAEVMIDDKWITINRNGVRQK